MEQPPRWSQRFNVSYQHPGPGGPISVRPGFPVVFSDRDPDLVSGGFSSRESTSERGCTPSRQSLGENNGNKKHSGMPVVAFLQVHDAGPRAAQQAEPPRPTKSWPRPRLRRKLKARLQPEAEREGSQASGRSVSRRRRGSARHRDRRRGYVPRIIRSVTMDDDPAAMTNARCAGGNRVCHRCASSSASRTYPMPSYRDVTGTQRRYAAYRDRLIDVPSGAVIFSIPEMKGTPRTVPDARWLANVFQVPGSSGRSRQLGNAQTYAITGPWLVGRILPAGVTEYKSCRPASPGPRRIGIAAHAGRPQGSACAAGQGSVAPLSSHGKLPHAARRQPVDAAPDAMKNWAVRDRQVQRTRDAGGILLALPRTELLTAQPADWLTMLRWW